MLSLPKESNHSNPKRILEIIFLLLQCYKSQSFTISTKSDHVTQSRHNQYNKIITPLYVLTTPVISKIEKISTEIIIDDLIDEATRLSSRKPIMMQFEPTPGGIWKRWKGTIFSESWKICLRNVMVSFVISFVLYSTKIDIKKYFKGFDVLIWDHILSLTTFTLTFFLNVSYNLWRKCYELSRRMQGKLNDIGLILAVHAARTVPSRSSELSTYTPASRQILELVSRYMRLFHVLTYASNTRVYRPMLTPSGMRRLVDRGLMTPVEREVLIDADIPATQRHTAVLLWIARVVIEARSAGHMIGGPGFEAEFLNKIHILHATMAAISGELNGRMRLAYAHIVQVLVDVMLIFYPFLAYVSGMNMTLSVLGTALLTISYQGLIDLAEKFLDPYDNENFLLNDDPNNVDPLCVDTLIAETNAGSVRWMNGFNEMPFSAQQILDGELQSHLLPVKGYSTQELIIRQEKQEKEEYVRRLKIKREKRVELIKKWKKEYALVDTFEEYNTTLPEHDDDGWYIKSIANLNDQTIIAYDNQTTTISSTNSSTSSSHDKLDRMNDNELSNEIIGLLQIACDTLVSLIQPRNGLKFSSIKDDIVEILPFVGNLSQYSNYDIDNLIENYNATDDNYSIEYKEIVTKKVPHTTLHASSNVTAINKEKSTNFSSIVTNGEIQPSIVCMNHHPNTTMPFLIDASYPNPSTSSFGTKFTKATIPLKENDLSHHIDLFTETISKDIENNNNSMEEKVYTTMIDHMKHEDIYTIGEQILSDSYSASNFATVENDSSLIISLDANVSSNTALESDANVALITVAKEGIDNHPSLSFEASRTSSSFHNEGVFKEFVPSSNTINSEEKKESQNVIENVQQHSDLEDDKIWFDTCDQDGQEIRLSQLLADEDWDDED